MHEGLRLQRGKENETIEVLFLGPLNEAEEENKQTEEPIEEHDIETFQTLCLHFEDLNTVITMEKKERQNIQTCTEGVTAELTLSPVTHDRSPGLLRFPEFSRLSLPRALNEKMT